MIPAWATLSLLSIRTLFVVDAIAVVLTAVLLWRSRARWRALVLAAGLAAAVAAITSWLVGDVLDLLDLSPTWVDRIWFSSVAALLAVAVVAVVRARWTTRVLAVLTVVAIIGAGSLAVNRDAGFYPTVADALGIARIPPIMLPSRSAHRAASLDTDIVRRWRPPADMPKRGRFGTVVIPGLVSHFSARRAVIYLPPAALIKDAPALPVVVMLSGQGPGASPYNVIEAGHMVSRMDSIARTHHGLAPIVVIPDQLGEAANNPMCVDGPLGNSATYLTVDVPDWIRTHLNVQTTASAWAIAGFSQGGTCSIQLGASDPALFGSLIDVSGQLGPTLDSSSESIRRGFRGDPRAWRQAQPARILEDHGPYRDSSAFFAVGEDDSRYGPALSTLSGLARRAGMRVKTLIVPESSHDWATAGIGLEAGVEWLLPKMGLAR